MPAVITEYLPPTDTQGSRIKATVYLSNGATVTFTSHHDPTVTDEVNHRQAARLAYMSSFGGRDLEDEGVKSSRMGPGYVFVT